MVAHFRRNRSVTYAKPCQQIRAELNCSARCDGLRFAVLHVENSKATGRCERVRYVKAEHPSRGRGTTPRRFSRNSSPVFEHRSIHFGPS